ncbi:MAG: PilN domain-containing protein [Methylophagaceae bacterium]
MQYVNFYQAQFQPKKLLLPAKQIGWLILLAIIILTIFSVYASQKNKLQRKTLTEQQQRHQNSQQQLELMQQQVTSQMDQPLLNAELVDIQQQVTDSQTMLDYLTSHSFGNQTGFASSLIGLSQQHINNVWLTEFSLTQGGESISLHGNAMQSELIPEYIDSLAKSKQFEGKEFSVFQLLQPSDGKMFYNFNLHTQNNVEAP